MTNDLDQAMEAPLEHAGGVQEGDIGDNKPVVTVMRNGTLRGPGGRFLSGPSEEYKLIPRGDSVTAAAKAKKRWDDAEEAARVRLPAVANSDELIGAGIDLRATSAEDAWGAGVAEVYKGSLLAANTRPQDSARALAFVGKATGMYRPQERNVQQVALQQVVVTGGRQLDAIEGEWEEG